MNIAKACEEAGVAREFVVYFIEEAWIVPDEEDFLDDEDLARIRLIKELRENFGVNDEGIPIILHLIDQINYIRLEINKSGPHKDPLNH